MQSLILCVMIHVGRAKVHRSVGLTEPSPTETRKLVRYPANFLGLGEALIFFCCFSSIKGRPLPRQGSFSWYFFKADHIIYPANFPGLGEALIFFCCFSSIKGRKAGRETFRNSGLQRVAKKKRTQIPDLGPLLRSNTPKFPI